jgi:hypothetical protein
MKKFRTKGPQKLRFCKLLFQKHSILPKAELLEQGQVLFRKSRLRDFSLNYKRIRAGRESTCMKLKSI